MATVSFDSIFLHNETVAFRDVVSSLHYSLPDSEMYLTASPQEIRTRQTIFRDFLTDTPFREAFTAACAHLDDFTELLRNLGNQSADSAEGLLYGLLELLAFTDTVDALDAAYSIAQNLLSERLIAFFTAIRRLKEAEEYRALRKWLHELDGNLRCIRSLTLGVNLDAQLNITEVGIVSINDQPFVCGNWLDKIMMMEQPPAEFQCMSVVGIREVKNWLQVNQMVINSEFYTSMNALYRKALKNLKKQILLSIQDAMRALASMRDDFHFLLRAVHMITQQKEQGFHPIFPEVGSETIVENLYNPLLVTKCKVRSIVPSSVSFGRDGKISILTGPNSGGKSVYLTSIGTAQISFQLGLPICAVGSAKMKPYRKIATHFIESTAGDTESRLAVESKRLQKILSGTDCDTLLLLDETFSSTSAYDALFLSECLMRYLMKTGCDAVYVTHLHELPSRLAAIPVIRHITPQTQDGQRTYRIVPYQGEEITSSLAKDIVIENGLGFIFAE